MEGVPDTFTPKSIAQCLVVFQENILFSYDENNFKAFQLTDQFPVVEVGDILTGCVVIDILVAVALEQIVEMFQRDGEIETAAEANDFVEESGIFKRQVDGMPGAEAAAGGNDGWVGVLFLYQIEDFCQNIVFVLEMAQDLFSGREGL